VGRSRSEYRVDITGAVVVTMLGARTVVDTDRDALAALMLDAYRGTIDDEGETLEDAYAAVDDYFGRILRDHSNVVVAADGSDRLDAMCFVVEVDGRAYVDPIAVTAARKGHGLGRGMVAMSLGSLAAAGITEVGATITDGNTPSERLFASLGFHRLGAWT
jgi:L-amino acid N-acyltransferase YncA